MFAGFVDQSTEYDWLAVLTAIAPDGNVTSGTAQERTATRQMRICGWRPGSKVPGYARDGAIGGSQKKCESPLPWVASEIVAAGLTGISDGADGAVGSSGAEHAARAVSPRRAGARARRRGL